MTYSTDQHKLIVSLFNIIDDTVGNARGTQYDQGDVLKTFNSFRAVAEPVPYEVFLRHYRTIDDQVPVTIDMDPDVFERVCNVFASTQFVLFLIGIVPGTRSVRLSRHDKLDKITRKIYANRIAFQDDPNALDDAIQELGEMRDMLWLRLERQDLVLEMYSTLYDDLKRSVNSYSRPLIYLMACILFPLGNLLLITRMFVVRG